MSYQFLFSIPPRVECVCVIHTHRPPSNGYTYWIALEGSLERNSLKNDQIQSVCVCVCVINSSHRVLFKKKKQNLIAGDYIPLQKKEIKENKKKKTDWIDYLTHFYLIRFLLLSTATATTTLHE